MHLKSAASAPAEGPRTERSTRSRRRATSCFPPVTVRYPGAFQTVLVARRSAVSAAHEKELQYKTGCESANVRPPGDASNLLRDCQGQGAAENLRQRPKTEIGQGRHFEEERKEQNRNQDYDARI